MGQGTDRRRPDRDLTTTSGTNVGPPLRISTDGATNPQDAAAERRIARLRQVELWDDQHLNGRLSDMTDAQFQATMGQRRTTRPSLEVLRSAPEQSDDLGEQDDESTCPICLEEYNTGASPETPVKLVKCGHVMGSVCMNRWLHIPQRSNGCPFCRKDVFKESLRQYRKTRMIADHLSQIAETVNPPLTGGQKAGLVRKWTARLDTGGEGTAATEGILVEALGTRGDDPGSSVLDRRFEAAQEFLRERATAPHQNARPAPENADAADHRNTQDFRNILQRFSEGEAFDAETRRSFQAQYAHAQQAMAEARAQRAMQATSADNNNLPVLRAEDTHGRPANNTLSNPPPAEQPSNSNLRNRVSISQFSPEDRADFEVWNAMQDANEQLAQRAEPPRAAPASATHLEQPIANNQNDEYLRTITRSFQNYDARNAYSQQVQAATPMPPYLTAEEQQSYPFQQTFNVMPSYTPVNRGGRQALYPGQISPRRQSSAVASHTNPVNRVGPEPVFPGQITPTPRGQIDPPRLQPVPRQYRFGLPFGTSRQSPEDGPQTRSGRPRGIHLRRASRDRGGRGGRGGRGRGSP